MNESFPTDDGLRRWLEDAPSVCPGTKMPAWKGIVREEDYAPLMGYVRHLGQTAQAGGKEAHRGEPTTGRAL